MKCVLIHCPKCRHYDTDFASDQTIETSKQGPAIVAVCDKCAREEFERMTA